MTVELCGFTSRVSVAPGNLQLPSRLVVLEQFTDPAESRVQTEEELFRVSGLPDVLLHLLVQRARGPSPICRLTVLELRCFPLESLR